MLKLTLNKTEIELLGLKVLLSERAAADVNDLTEFSRSKPNKDLEIITYEALIVLRDGLRINKRSLKWWQIIRRLKIRKLCNLKYMLTHLSQREIFTLAEKVYELEGVDLKKKIIPEQEPESAEVLATRF